MNRRTSALVCLLLTAALFAALPSLLAALEGQDTDRMAQRLRPAKVEPLMVWLLTDATDCQKYLQKQISLFEKQNPGVRVFLRRADAAELTAPEAVPPDVVLFSPGCLGAPDKVIRPLVAEVSLPPLALLSGQYAGAQYALPLWIAPSVLAVPTELLPPSGAATPVPVPTSFFDLGTPAPGLQDALEGKGPAPLPDPSLIPWETLIRQRALQMPKGFALQQLLSMCPPSMGSALVASLTAAPTAITSPVPTPPARALTFAAYRQAVAGGQALSPFPMTPAVTQAVLLIGLCRDSAPAEAFLTYLLSEDAQKALPDDGLFPLVQVSSTYAADPLAAQLAALYGENLLLPNAFEHTAQEIESLCLDGFTRMVDPVETLLRLR